jgi:hypothetical protein
MNAVNAPETLLAIYQTTRRHMQRGSSRGHRCRNLKGLYGEEMSLRTVDGSSEQNRDGGDITITSLVFLPSPLLFFFLFCHPPHSVRIPFLALISALILHRFILLLRVSYLFLSRSSPVLFILPFSLISSFYFAIFLPPFSPIFFLLFLLLRLFLFSSSFITLSWRNDIHLYSFLTFCLIYR